jgi:hypothetical protein
MLLILPALMAHTLLLKAIGRSDHPSKPAVYAPPQSRKCRGERWELNIMNQLPLLPYT